MYHYKMVVRMEAGFTLNNRPKGTKNTPSRHQAHSSNRFPSIWLQFTLSLFFINSQIKHFIFLKK